MLRALLAALAIALLLGVLSLLTIESTSVTEDYYIAHANRVRAIETSKEDLTAIIQGSQSAFGEGRSMPESVDLAISRLTTNNQLLQGMLASLRAETAVETQLAEYDQALSEFIGDAQTFSTRQNALAAALRTLQEDSPVVVKDLRRYDLRIQSQNTCSLAIEVIEFATGQRRPDVAQLRERIENLHSDPAVDSVVPGRLDEFASAANLVITEHLAAESALEKVRDSGIRDNLWLLSDQILDENRRTVSRAERARLLLSICAVLILAGAGYAMLKLQRSYRELNRSKAELEKVNNSLEDRVASRTDELSEAYDHLKESQVQLVQAEKMSSLGELVAGISHEINTPLYYLMSNATVVHDCLNSVKSFLDIAEKMIAAVAAREGVKEVVTRGLLDMRGKLTEGMRDDVEEAQDLIQDSIEGLEELTELAQSLKDFSRLDRAKQGEFDVNEGLDKTLLIAKNRIKNKVTVHKHYGDVPMIHCSPSQINQIFLNLITNAADAIEATGELVLRTWLEVDKVCISVGDSGVGIPEDVLAKIRDPFFTTKEVGKGTGLGLSIVEQIVTSHNGELKIESEPGKGTLVTVKLPIGAAMQQKARVDRQVEAATDSGDATDVTADVEAANEPSDREDTAVGSEPEEVTA